MTRTGKIPPGNTIVKCISKNFPELHKDILKFLVQDGDGLSRKGAQNPPKQPSEAQGWGLKRFFVGLLGRVKARQ